MSVKISVLEKKTTKELYYYIQPNSRFVPQAIQYAFDILQKRGELFDAEEISRINKLITDRQSIEDQEVIKNKPWDKNSVEDGSAIQYIHNCPFGDSVLLSEYFLVQYFYS